MFSLSTHPVWVVLSNYGLPDEIINLIYSYSTFYSPIKYTFAEFHNCIDYKKNMSQFNGITIDKLIFTIKYNLGKYENNYRFNRIIHSFLNKYCNYYRKNEDLILNKFIEYCDEDNIQIPMLTKIKNVSEDSFLINNIKTIVGCSLKTGLQLVFYNKIYGIYTSDIDFEEEQELCYDYQTNKFKLNLLWKNIMYVLKYKHVASKTDLLMFNFLCGIKYARRWTKTKLITNLYKIENMDYNIIIEQLDKWPYIYTISELYEAMNTDSPSPFSKDYGYGKSIKKEMNDEANFNTLNSYNIISI